uniref:Uncharacterized protein n=1 Tax=Arundo donax TaxID=35708 RepID=A0A0A9A2Q0_ARUDO
MQVFITLLNLFSLYYVCYTSVDPSGLFGMVLLVVAFVHTVHLAICS